MDKLEIARPAEIVQYSSAIVLQRLLDARLRVVHESLRVDLGTRVPRRLARVVEVASTSIRVTATVGPVPIDEHLCAHPDPSTSQGAAMGERETARRALPVEHLRARPSSTSQGAAMGERGSAPAVRRVGRASIQETARKRRAVARARTARMLRRVSTTRTADLLCW